MPSWPLVEICDKYMVIFYILIYFNKCYSISATESKNINEFLRTGPVCCPGCFQLKSMHRDNFVELQTVCIAPSAVCILGRGWCCVCLLNHVLCYGDDARSLISLAVARWSSSLDLTIPKEEQ